MNLEESTLVKLVRSFPASVYRDIRKFLSSPFFTTREDLLPLFNRIVDGPLTFKAELWSDLYSSTPFDDQRLRLLMSYLHKLLETYVSLSEWAADDVQQGVMLAVGYRKRGLNSQYSKARQGAEKRLNKRSLRDGHYHTVRYELMWEEYALQTVQNPTDPASFQEMVYHVDAAYLSNRLRLICMAYAQRQVYHTTLETLDVAEVIAMAERTDKANTPAVTLYLACYRMLREPDQVHHFHAFTTTLDQCQDVFERDEMRGLYLQAINYCIRKLNNGEDSFFSEVLSLYKSGLDQEYLLEQGILSRFAYHNIVAAALHVGDLEWVNTFIYAYKGQLERKYRESSFSFNLARLEYERQRYAAVLQLLQKANYRDPLLNLAARTLLLKTWYETGEHELLQSHLDAMRNYIHRKQVIGYHKENYLNIVRYADKILKVNMNDDKTVAQLRLAISTEEVLTEKKWFMTCMDEARSPGHSLKG